MNIREMIEKLTDLAENHLPRGMDSEVKGKVCNGQDTDGLLTTSLNIDMLTEDYGTASAHAFAIVDLHPHLDENLRTLPSNSKGLDEELARLAAGEDIEQRPLPGGKPINVTAEDEAGRAMFLGTGDGWAYRLPYSAEGVLLLPGMPDAIAAGCTCDPEKNQAVLRRVRAEGDPSGPAPQFVIRRGCPLHPRGPMPRQDPT